MLGMCGACLAQESEDQREGERRGRPLQRGPWENDIIVYHARANGEVERLSAFERAGVSTLNRMKDGRLIAAHQHFPEGDPAAFDKVAVRFSPDQGRHWTAPEVMQLNGLPEGMRFPFDPTLVILPDGRVRMYFTSLKGRQFTQDVPCIHSAISEDGVHYTYEPGVRFAIEGRFVIDCAVLLHQGVFHLYSPDNGERPQGRERPGQPPELQGVDGKGYHATSSDGLQFTRAADVEIEGRRRWLGNAQSEGGQIIFFGTGEPAGQNVRGGVFTATSSDGILWKLTNGPAIFGADPGAVSDGSGGWIVTVTGPPRDGGGGRFQPALRPEDEWLRNWMLELLLDQALKRPAQVR